VEQWAPIAGWETLYAVSDAGNVYSFRRKKNLTGFSAGAGYLQVTLADLPKRKMRAYVHLLVAEAFLPPRPGPRFEVNHLNLDKLDNRATNLRWVAHARNQRHAAVYGRMQKHGQRKLDAAQVDWVRANRNGSAHKMAAQLGVTSIVIYQIWNDLTYRDV